MASDGGMKDEVLELARQQMEESLGAFRHEMSRVRTGRASTALRSGIVANYPGPRPPRRHVAGLAAP